LDIDAAAAGRADGGLTGAHEHVLARPKVGDLDQTADDMHDGALRAHAGGEGGSLDDHRDVGCQNLEMLFLAFFHVEQKRAQDMTNARHQAAGGVARHLEDAVRRDDDGILAAAQDGAAIRVGDDALAGSDQVARGQGHGAQAACGDVHIAAAFGQKPCGPLVGRGRPNRGENRHQKDRGDSE